MIKSKMWKIILIIFIVSCVFLWFGKISGSEWVAIVFSNLLGGLGRDTVKDKDSALNNYVETKRESIKNSSDADLASRLDKQ